MTEITDRQIEEFIAKNLTELNLKPKEGYEAMLLSTFKGLADSIGKEGGFEYIDSQKYRVPTGDMSYYSNQIDALTEAKDSSKSVPGFLTIMGNFEQYVQSLAPKIEEPAIEPIKEAEPESTKPTQSFLSRLLKRAAPFTSAAAAVAMTVVSNEAEAHGSKPISGQDEINNSEERKPMNAKKYVETKGLIKPIPENFAGMDYLDKHAYEEIMAAGREGITNLLNMLPEIAHDADSLNAVEAKLAVILRDSPAINRDASFLEPSAKAIIADYARQAGLTEVLEAVLSTKVTAQSEVPSAAAEQALQAGGARQQS